MFKKVRILFLLILAFIIISPLPVLADAAPVRGLGASIVPIENRQITMSQEKVTIRVIESDEPEGNPVRDLLVEARFTFTNEGDETTLKMGFPFPLDKEGNPPYWQPTSFEVTVNGNRVKYTDEKGETGDYGLWYVWEVTIPANESVEVLTRYRIHPSQAYNEDYSDPFLYSRYILKSGAYWKGNIGQAKIYLEFDPRKLDIYRALPGNYKEDYGIYLWDLLNFEPEHDISFEIWGKNMLQAFFNTEKSKVGPDQVKASSSLLPEDRNSPLNAFDGDNSTAWAEGGSAYGEGEWIWFNLSQENKVGEKNPFYLEEIGIVNGNAKSQDLFQKNCRVKDMTIEFSNGLKKNITLRDNDQVQWFKISPADPTDSVKFIIQSVYPGSANTDTCISDIYFRGTYSPKYREKYEQN